MDLSNFNGIELRNFYRIYGSSEKAIFGSLGYPLLPWQRVCQGVLKIF